MVECDWYAELTTLVYFCVFPGVIELFVSYKLDIGRKIVMEGHGRLAKKREVIDDNLIKSQIKIKMRLQHGPGDLCPCPPLFFTLSHLPR
jgi:hypothetical protein